MIPKDFFQQLDQAGRVPVVDVAGNGVSLETETRAVYVPPKLTDAEKLILTNGVEIGLAWARKKALADMADFGGRPASDFAERLCRDAHQSDYIASRDPLYRGRW